MSSMAGDASVLSRMREVRVKSTSQGRLAIASLACAFLLMEGIALPMAACAGPIPSVHTPTVHYHRWQLEFKGGIQNWEDHQGKKWASKIELGYGVTRYWKSVLELEYSRRPGQAARVSKYEFQNTFQLSGRGGGPFAAGILSEVAHDRLDHGTVFELGPMLQERFGRQRVNLNILFERRIASAARRAESNHTQIKYQAQWKWLANTKLEPGIQVFGKLGTLGDLHSQALRAGPAAFGKIELGHTNELEYAVALLSGVTRDTPKTTFHLLVEYTF
jgi:hypothetical protein